MEVGLKMRHKAFLNKHRWHRSRLEKYKMESICKKESGGGSFMSNWFEPSAVERSTCVRVFTASQLINTLSGFIVLKGPVTLSLGIIAMLYFYFKA